MLTGMPPFYSKDREKLFNIIKTEQVKFHKYLSKEAVDLLTKLFIKDPEKRLGSGPNGLNDIKSHPFFASINWESILEKKIKPPFTPKLRVKLIPDILTLNLLLVRLLILIILEKV